MAETLSPDHPARLHAWDVFNDIRAAAALGAFLSLVVAAGVRTDTSGRHRGAGSAARAEDRHDEQRHGPPDPDLALERAVAVKYAGEHVDVEPPGTPRFAATVTVRRVTAQRGSP